MCDIDDIDMMLSLPLPFQSFVLICIARSVAIITSVHHANTGAPLTNFFTPSSLPSHAPRTTFSCARYLRLRRTKKKGQSPVTGVQHSLQIINMIHYISIALM